MSHALLLRLFLSPYFSISVAMHYLKLYPDSIGISHYLCWRMKYMPAEEVEFYWPQICHLLITYPTPSNALESFVLERAEESTHSAMLTFWFMQSALKDLTPSRISNPGPFLICQRILHKCHEIIFGDPPEPSRSPYRSLPHPSSTSSLQASGSGSKLAVKRGKVNAHAGAALVGMGVMLAGAGITGLTELTGEWAIRQGRRPIEDDEGRARVELEKDGGADVRVNVNGDVPGSSGTGVRPGMEERKPSSDSDVSAEDKAEQEHEFELQSHPSGSQLSRLRQEFGSPHAPILKPMATSPQLYSPSPQASSPNISRSPSIDQSRSKAVDPFSQLPAPISALGRMGTPPRHQPFHSVPEISHSNGRLHPTDRPPPPEVLLAAYSLDAQRQLLRSHYCRSEIRFLLLLEDISNRLLVVPKPARVSALRAELTGLNHNLPAEVCMPLWCEADHCHEEGGETSSGNPLKARADLPRNARKRAHARVVRISPGDSVVLNSAEKAPYLLHVELLEGDLDFDPTRRENRELLKKIVVQEDMKKRKGVGYDIPTRGALDGFGSPMTDAASRFGYNNKPRTPPPPTGTAAGPSPKPPFVERKASTHSVTDVESEEPEEMDLVEQLYGAKISVKDAFPDLSETIPLPQGPKNKALDVAAWERDRDRDRDRSPGSQSRRQSITESPNPSSQPLLGRVLSPQPRMPATPDISVPPSPALSPEPQLLSPPPKRVITLEDYSERMRTAAVMLAQLNASQISTIPEGQSSSSGGGGALSWIPGTGWIRGSSPRDPNTSVSSSDQVATAPGQGQGGKLRLAAAQAAAIRERIMEEMMSLEEERVERMTERPEGVGVDGGREGEGKTAEDEGIVRRELSKSDPSAAVFRESWSAKKSRIRAASPWGHLANWDVISVIVKTGADLRQEQLATQLIERFSKIWKEEKCDCWVRFFRILITGEQSGLVETITDAVSVHSIKKGEYARRLSEGGAIGHVSLMDHYVNTYGKPDSGRFARAQRNFIKSLAGYSVVTYLLQIKDRHNGNILVDRDGHLIHIDFGFMLSNSPGGNMGFEAAPFKLPLEYVDILGGLDSPGWIYFKKLFKEGFECARKHSDSLIAIVELMQKNSKLDCFILFGEQTAHHFKERFALGLTTAAVDAYLERLILSSTGSNYTRLYDTFQYYSQGVL